LHLTLLSQIVNDSECNVEKTKITYKSLALRIKGVFFGYGDDTLAYRAKLYSSSAREPVTQEMFYTKMKRNLFF
jgi:hypothetical protein